MKLAFLDCGAGISGDMLLAAMIDAGGDRDLLLSLPARLRLPMVNIVVNETRRAGMRALRVEVNPGEEKKERNLEAIKAIINHAEIPAAVKSDVIATFDLLARAEAAAHGCGPGEINFHETGGLDAIIDICGAFILADSLRIDRFSASPLPMPSGTTTCAHGAIPLPAPALATILTGVEIYGTGNGPERVTPTGAAIIKILAAGFGPMPTMRLITCGHGAGSRETSGGIANILRIFIGEGKKEDGDEVEIIRCNIDDMNPELAAALAESLLAAGALDTTLCPVIMKKGRPGFILEAIALPENGPALRELILRESSSIGLRYQRMPRQVLPRVNGSVATVHGRVGVKKITGPEGERITPEFEDCRRIAAKTGTPVTAVYQAVENADPETFREEEH